MNSNQIEDNVKKILAARKVQKNRIEQSRSDNILEAENIKKKSREVVGALKSGFEKQTESAQDARTQQAQEAQRMIDQLKQSGDKSNNMLENFMMMQRALQAQKDEESEAEEEEEEDPNKYWIQNLYTRYRVSKKSKTTNYEIDPDGKIGLNGNVDIAKLFNDNSVSLKVDKKIMYQIPSSQVTMGVAALILLPYNDLMESKIEITRDDAIKYKRIMDLSGYRAGASKKYGEILKKVIPRSESAEGRDAVHGTGVFAYNNPKMLHNRLQLLSGSVKAGNTSREVKSEIRSIVDEMLRISNITPRIHKMLYQKFGFLY